MQFSILAMLLFLLSPLVLAAYLALIFYHILLVRSKLIISDTGMELLYETVAPSQCESRVKESDTLDKVCKLTLRVKITRGVIFQESFFQKSSLRAVLKLGDEVYETRSVKTLDLNPVWFGNHDFVFNPERNLKMKIIILDSDADGNDKALGTCSESVERWIANGRFEGDVLVKKLGRPVGKVSLVVKLLRETTYSATYVPRMEVTGPPAPTYQMPSVAEDGNPVDMKRSIIGEKPNVMFTSAAASSVYDCALICEPLIGFTNLCILFSQLLEEEKSQVRMAANVSVISAEVKSAGHQKEKLKIEDHKKKIRLFSAEDRKKKIRLFSPEDRDRIFHGVG